MTTRAARRKARQQAEIAAREEEAKPVPIPDVPKKKSIFAKVASTAVITKTGKKK